MLVQMIEIFTGEFDKEFWPTIYFNLDDLSNYRNSNYRSSSVYKRYKNAEEFFPKTPARENKDEFAKQNSVSVKCLCKISKIFW